MVLPLQPAQQGLILPELLFQSGLPAGPASVLHLVMHLHQWALQHRAHGRSGSYHCPPLSPVHSLAHSLFHTGHKLTTLTFLTVYKGGVSDQETHESTHESTKQKWHEHLHEWPTRLSQDTNELRGGGGLSYRDLPSVRGAHTDLQSVYPVGRPWHPGAGMGMEVFGTDKTILVDNDHMEPVDLLHSKHQHHCLDLQVPLPGTGPRAPIRRPSPRGCRQLDLLLPLGPVNSSGSSFSEVLCLPSLHPI